LHKNVNCEGYEYEVTWVVKVLVKAVGNLGEMTNLQLNMIAWREIQ
jgi:hypothetical protein